MHNICSQSAALSSWGTLTFGPSTHSGQEINCWCKLSAQNHQRIVLSVISFHLAKGGLNCSNGGLYLQSDRKRSTDCTSLQQSHYYISSSHNLFINYFIREAKPYQEFWIIYEVEYLNQFNYNLFSTEIIFYLIRSATLSTGSPHHIRPLNKKTFI